MSEWHDLTFRIKFPEGEKIATADPLVLARAIAPFCPVGTIVDYVWLTDAAPTTPERENEADE